MRAPVVALLVLALSASTVTSRPLSLPQRTQHFSMCASPHMEVITYSGTSYAMYSRRNWQLLAVQARHPVAFALPGTPAALAAAVVCATRAGLAFRARGGGHSYEGASRVDQGLVIDLERFNRVDVDAADDVAVVGAGQRLGEVYLRLLRAGRVFPAGTCAGNGVSGFLLGGGIGPFTRALGWATGAVVEARGVTAGGKMVVASSTRNPDLFWALRGGGGGHVIVYEWKLRLARQPKHMAWCYALWDRKQGADPAERVVNAAMAWRLWEIPSDITSVNLYVEATYAELELAAWEGTQDDLRARIEAANLPQDGRRLVCDSGSVLDFLMTTSGTRPASAFSYKASLAREYGNATHPPDPTTTGHHRFKISSWVYSEPLTQGQVAGAMALMPAGAGRGAFNIRVLGGARLAPGGPHDEGAMGHAGSGKMWLDVFSGRDQVKYPDHPQALWVRQMSEALAPRTRASFYNWLDCSIWPTPSSNGRKPTREELARLYFGAGAQRVLELKERWDPENRLGMFCE